MFQKYPSLPFKDMLKLDLPNCGLKHVDLSPVHCFSNLARFGTYALLVLHGVHTFHYYYSLNLENNSLTSFGGLIFLDQLKVSCSLIIHAVIC